MKRKTLAAFLLCLMSAALLAGCGKSTDQSDISDKLKDKLATVSGQGQEKDKPESIEKACQNT